MDPRRRPAPPPLDESAESGRIDPLRRLLERAGIPLPHPDDPTTADRTAPVSPPIDPAASTPPKIDPETPEPAPIDSTVPGAIDSVSPSPAARVPVPEASREISDPGLPTDPHPHGAAPVETMPVVATLGANAAPLTLVAAPAAANAAATTALVTNVSHPARAETRPEPTFPPPGSTAPVVLAPESTPGRTFTVPELLNPPATPLAVRIPLDDDAGVEPRIEPGRRGGLGRHGAHLLLGVATAGRCLFRWEEALERTGLHQRHCESLLRGLVRKGWLRRLRKGLYGLIPLDRATGTAWLPDPIVILHHVYPGAAISHGAAMRIHGVRQRETPTFPFTVLTGRRLPPVTIDGLEFHAVYKPELAGFGLVRRAWCGEMVTVTDPERTVLDGFLHPDLCGGLWETVRACATLAPAFDWTRLDEHLRRLKKRVLFKRIGFVCELLGLSHPFLGEWQQRIDANYNLLDPSGVGQGPTHARWRLRLNINPDLLKLIARG